MLGAVKRGRLPALLLVGLAAAVRAADGIDQQRVTPVTPAGVEQRVVPVTPPGEEQRVEAHTPQGEQGASQGTRPPENRAANAAAKVTVGVLAAAISIAAMVASLLFI